ncbi:hypothetical protein [Sphingomonas sp. 22176]|uniref:hypothetical protein n=1 Tax=Sphingomonas sp. 22176 TaxID=3453884 RepID=UPI003F85AB2F
MSILTVAAAAVIGLVLGTTGRRPRQSGVVRIVNPPRLAVPPALALETPGARSGPPPAALLAEAPSVLRSLHASIASDSVADADAAAQVRALFAAAAGLSIWSVSCGRSRCEVQGDAAADESVTRLRLRDPTILDALSAHGMTAGMDIVREANGRSSFILFVDRAPGD